MYSLIYLTAVVCQSISYDIAEALPCWHVPKWTQTSHYPGKVAWLGFFMP